MVVVVAEPAGLKPPPINPATTISIQANMDANYLNEQLLISNAIVNCYRTWGQSGGAIVCAVNAKQLSVSNFLKQVILNIAFMKSSSPVDKAAIANLITAYQIKDLAWLTINSLSPTHTMTLGELGEVKPTYDSSVNTSYSNALIQLSGL